MEAVCKFLGVVFVAALVSLVMIRAERRNFPVKPSIIAVPVAVPAAPGGKAM